MQMRSSIQPIESLNDATDDVIFIVCVDLKWGGGGAGGGGITV